MAAVEQNNSVKKPRNWFMDFEAFTTDKKFWLKELCILPCLEEGDVLDEDIHYNYFIKANDLKDRTVGCYNWQFKRHGLRYEFGDYNFNEAIRDVQLKVGNGSVLVKGKEKALFLAKYFNVVELPETLCSFKKCRECMEKACRLGHSKTFCAKRKVYILRDAYNKMAKKPDLYNCYFVAYLHVIVNN